MTRPKFHEIRGNQELALLVLVWFNQVGSKNMSLEFFVDTFRAKFSDFNSRSGGPAPSNRAIRKLVNQLAREYPNIQLTMTHLQPAVVRGGERIRQWWYINGPDHWRNFGDEETPPNTLPRYPFNSKTTFESWKETTVIDLTILPFAQTPWFNPAHLSERGRQVVERFFPPDFFVINWCGKSFIGKELI